MFKRIKNLWKLSETTHTGVIAFARSEFTPEVAKEIADRTGKLGVLVDDINSIKLSDYTPKVKGDGKAEFIGQGTEEEYKEFEQEQKGFKGIFGIGK